ncbi:MAG: alpha/beta hydrolase [Proteobacteria bacterium]|nr:alpha/beta hydrolase [Pseudomonadota bacterium]
MLNNPPQSCLNKVEIQQQQLSNHNQVAYYYCMGAEKITNIIVLVHGVSRNARDIITSFSQVMDSNSILIAPVFTKEYATDYQRLGRKNKGPRADYILQAIVNELKNQYNITCDKLNLFGFSAGAQFAHRYAFAYPHTVNKVAIVAAGWYTLPSDNIAYPVGLKITDEFADIDFELLRLLRTKFRVYIGEKDYLRDKALNKSKQVDALQGKDRIERAKNWVKSMHQQCLKHKINNKIKLVILPNVVHDFQDANNLAQLSNKVSSWFLASNK